MVSKVVAIIPARGGSKRLPNKNIMDFMGKPMIAWTIEAAQKSNLFDVILVSTDSQEIADISINYGAEAPFLRDNYADDMAPVSLATMSALRQLENTKNTFYDVVVQLMPNCPIRTEKTIKAQYDYFVSLNMKYSVLSSFEYGMFNPWWAHKRNEDGSYSKIFDGDSNTRSQDLPELLCPTGATWITTKKLLNEYESFYSLAYHFFKIDWKEAVDIDDLQDLEMAKTAYCLINEIQSLK